MPDDEKTQLDKFKDAARELECDDDATKFQERVKKLAKARPASANDSKPGSKV